MPCDGLLERPEGARWLFVLAHGAGAGMRHRFMEAIAKHLAAESVATFRYEFPFAESGRRFPDPKPVLLATVRDAVAEARRRAPDLPVIAGGKSMGGRMTSLAASESPLDGVRGLVFLGFPLHAPGRDSTERAAHLGRVDMPMLFVQGTRDRLAGLTRIREVCGELRAALHVVDGGDHSFGVLKRSGRSLDGVMREIARTVSRWAADTA